MQRNLAIGAAVALVVSAGLVFAITYGTPDGTAHPNVGALLAQFSPAGPWELICSGSLISTTVLLTASHCTAYLQSLGIAIGNVRVSLQPDAGAPWLAPTSMITNPAFNQRQSDPADLGVLILPEVGAITPAALPTAGLLDQMKDDGDLKGRRSTP